MEQNHPEHSQQTAFSSAKATLKSDREQTPVDNPIGNEKEPTDSPQLNYLNGFVQLPPTRKNLLYIVLGIALGVDTLGTSAFLTTIELIAKDIGLHQGGNAIWIVSAYATAFAACIPLGGRLSDISPPQWWYLAGFTTMSGLTLGNSFVQSKEALLALRALQGICAALTMPASYSMIVHMFPEKAQQEKRLIGVMVVCALGTFSGFIIGALLSMAHWRWIFRFLACLAFACAVSGWLLMPKPSIVPFHGQSPARPAGKWNILRKLDLVGVALIMGCLLLFNLALTNATVYGWSAAKFIAPFIISVLLLPAFCLWEAKQKEGYAILPVTLLKKTVFLVLCFTGIAAEIWGSMSQIGGSRYFSSVLHDSSIVVAGKLSVQGQLISRCFWERNWNWATHCKS